MNEEKGLFERIENGLTTDVDAQRLRELMFNLSELIAGIHHLADDALQALECGDWRQVRCKLEQMAAIE